MKIFKILPLALLILGVLLFSFSEPVYLIKIPKGDLVQRGILEKFQVEVVQELGTCFIARANREDFRILRKSRIYFSILDKNIEGKEYFLVRASSRDKLAGLQAKGRLIAVEKGTLLCWTKGEALAAAIPPDVVRKPLPSTSILSFLKRPSPPVAIQEYRAAKDDLIEFIVNMVSKSNLRSFVQGLEAFQTRYASTSNCETAGDFIFHHFQTLGLETSYEPFSFQGSYSSRNIIAEKRGKTDPDEIMIICAHYDSTSGNPTVLAPGADDNASGTAAVMEAARILLPYSFDFTIRFIAFSAEEWGLYGSQYDAARARSRDEEIIGVINLDMIAYADTMPEDLELIVNPDSEWLAERLGLSATSYTGLPVRKIVNDSFVYSDHASFWDEGYSALLAIEDEPLSNPYYHQTTDTVDTLNFDFYTNATKTALGALAELAQPIRIGYPRTPVELEAKVYGYTSLFNALGTVYLSWAASPDAVGYNVYRSTTSHLNYKKLNSAPVSSTAFVDRILNTSTYYFYVVTALDNAGQESNRSGEVKIEPIIVVPAQAVSQDSSSLGRRGNR
jgi:hypothetical protein